MTLAASVNQGRLLPKGVAYNRAFFMGVTGLTLTVTISKNGAAFGAMAGTVAEISVGWYKAALTAGDTDTEGDLAFHATDGGTNIEDWADQVAANVKMADGVTHGGTTAKLRLGSAGGSAPFYVTNASGTAVRWEGGGSGDGLYIAGAGTGNGITIYSGDGDNGAAVYMQSLANNNGMGLYIVGAGTLPGLRIDGGTTSPGAIVSGGFTSGPGLQLTGRGADSGLEVIGGSSGDAVYIHAAAGNGINVSGAGSGKYDIKLSGTGTLSGIIPANVKKVNDVTVTGTGASGDEWGP